MIHEFDAPTAVIVKHNNPCGIASDKSIDRAYIKAFKCDSLSAFGGIIGFNRCVDAKTARLLSKAVLWNASSLLNLRHKRRVFYRLKRICG